MNDSTEIFKGSFADRLREVRKDLNLKQKEFAKKLRVDPSYISQLESGKHKTPSSMMIEAISSIFPVNREWLLSGQGDRYYEEPFRDDQGRGITRVEAAVLGGKKLQEMTPQAREAYLSAKPGDRAEGTEAEGSLAHAVAQLKEIYEFADPDIIRAIESNLSTFVGTVRQKKELEELKNKVNALFGMMSRRADQIRQGDPIDRKDDLLKMRRIDDGNFQP